MKITTHVEPSTPPMSWDDFCQNYPPNSIALDGFCAAPPALDQLGKHVNFNHHEQVDRLATRATCAQVLTAIRSGLFDFFDAGEPVHVYVNDCDEDVCLSLFLLNRSYLGDSAMNPVLNRLVFIEDMLDSTGGTYQLPKALPIMGQIAWIFEPYRRFRTSGQIDQRSVKDFEAVIEAVGDRIMRHIMGSGDFIDVDSSYEVLRSSKSFVVVKETGANARSEMFYNGVKAYVAARQRADGRWTYTVGKKSQFINFDISAIVNKLNQVECQGTLDRWGGSPVIAGSPRISGSKLDPDEVCQLIESMAS